MVHVSGHPRRAEMEELISWVRPQIVVPVHGEALHLSEHEGLARLNGVKHVVGCRNGDLLQLGPGKPEIVDEVPAGRLYKDGNLLISAESKTVADRRRLAFVGLVSLAMAVSDKGELMSDPEIELIGIPEKDGRGQDMGDLAFDAAVNAFDQMARARRRDPDTVTETVRRAVRGAIGAAWGKKPIVHVHILAV
jgi:ribonuclease J